MRSTTALKAAELSFIPNPFRSQAELEKFLDFLLIEAFDAGENAGYSGSQHDGGRQQLEDQVAAFNAGHMSVTNVAGIPLFWKSYLQKFFRANADQDELAMYKKLHVKYGGI
jgi:hypothetical protein